MLLTDQIKLITQTKTMDADGRYSVAESFTTALCDAHKGVTRSEFYEAMKAGVKMAKAFELWACDYGNQTIVEHDSKRYKVERAFWPGDATVQLNCSEVTR